MKRILNGFLILLVILLISTAYVAGLIIIYQLYKSSDNPAYLLVYLANFGVITWMLGKDED
jgi:4-amino-4-deoxy-L-arabinose transferase-like glycosyltransferase